MDYQYILSTIEDDIQESEESTDTDNTTTADDINMLQTVKTQSGDRGYILRDILYTDLLEIYIDIYSKNSSHKKWYKLFFFIVVIGAFIAIITTSIVAMFMIMNMDKSTAQIVATAIASLGSMLSALIVLPKIIAKHLFPKDEESHILEMVKNMQLNDSNIRDHQK